MFEMTRKKSKNVALKEDTKDCDDQVECDAHENLIESIDMHDNSFSKVMRRLDKRSKNNVYTIVKDNQHKNPNGGNFQHKRKHGEKYNKAKGIQYLDCEFLDIFKVNVQIFFKNKKGYNLTL